MRNYEAEKFINLYIRKINEKGKNVKITFAKKSASKKEIDEIFGKINPEFVAGWEKYCKQLAKDFKVQREIFNYREFVVNSRKPGKKLAAEYNLPSEIIIL